MLAEKILLFGHYLLMIVWGIVHVSGMVLLINSPDVTENYI